MLLDVTVVDPSQRRALAIATGIARQAPALATTFSTSTGSAGAGATSFRVVDGPSVGSVPHTRTRLTAALGALGGLAAGLGLAVLAELRDHRARSPIELATAAGAPAIGAVYFDAALAADPAATAGPWTAESLRQLRTAVRFLAFPGQGCVLAFAAPTPGAGVSTLVAQLARATARAGRRVCVVDANLRNPTQARVAALDPGPGLSTVLAARAELGPSVRRVAGGVDLVPGGPAPPNPSELLDSTALDQVLATLRREYDLVLVDAAPVLPFADTTVLGRRTDGVVLVTRYGRSSLAAVASAAAALRAVGVAVPGVVLTVTPHDDGAAGYVTNQRIDTNPKPTTEISVSIADQDLKV